MLRARTTGLPSWTGSRHVLVLCAGLVLLAGMAVVSVCVGSGDPAPARAWELLWNPEPGYASSVVHTLRVPRTLLGVAGGAALAVAGTLMQALTRNPLADPGILGVNAGAAAGTVLAISVFGLTTFSGYVWFGLLGTAVAAGVTFLVGISDRGGNVLVRLALAGTAVNATLIALTEAFIYLDFAAFSQYRSWMVGSLTAGGGLVGQTLPFVAAGLLLALTLGRSLDALALGDTAGRALGARAGRTRAFGMLAITLLCGSVTAAVGPIAFVGLAVPHLMRAVTGPNHRRLLLYCLVFGPLLLLAADVLGRTIGAEIEVSIMTALLGGPFFLAIVRRRRLAEL